jgi:hypothetical protein
MKKITYTLAALSFAAIFFTSCKKSSTNNSIVGSWVLTSGTIVTTDSTTTPYKVTTKDTTIANPTDLIQFNADYTYSEFNLGSSPSITDSGRYAMLKGTLVIFQTGATTPVSYPYSVSGNTLTLEQTNNSTGSSTHISEKLTRQ